MTKVTIVSGETLDSFYDRTQQYFKDTYHNYPTSLTGKSVGANVKSAINHHDAHARNHSNEIGSDLSDLNLGKEVF